MKQYELPYITIFLTFRDVDKNFQLNGDLLKMITIKHYNPDFARLPNKTPMFEFAKKCVLMKKHQVIIKLGINHL